MSSVRLTDIVEYVDIETGRRRFDAAFAARTIQPLLDSAREAVGEAPLYDIAFEGGKPLPHDWRGPEKARRGAVTVAPLIRRAEIVRVLPQWLNPGEEGWRWIALEDQDPETRRFKIAPLNSKLTIVPTEIVDGHMVEGTGMIVPVQKAGG